MRVVLLLLFFGLLHSLLFAGGSQIGPQNGEVLVLLPQRNDFHSQLMLDAIRTRALKDSIGVQVGFFEQSDPTDVASTFLSSSKQYRAMIVLMDEESGEYTQQLVEDSQENNTPIIFSGFWSEELEEVEYFVGSTLDEREILKEYMLDISKDNPISAGLFLRNLGTQKIEFLLDDAYEPEILSYFDPFDIQEILLGKDVSINNLSLILEATILETSIPPTLLIAETALTAVYAAQFLRNNQLEGSIPLISLEINPDIISLMEEKRIHAAMYTDAYTLGTAVMDVAYGVLSKRKDIPIPDTLTQMIESEEASNMWPDPLVYPR